MQIVKLKDISLASSNVTASSYSEYAAATTYSIDNTVKVSFESDGTTPLFPVQEYKSLAGSNVGNYPPNDSTKWLFLGVENKGKMFDDYTNTQTEKTDSIQVELNVNSCNAVGLFNLQATDVEFTHIVNTELLTDGDCSADSFTKGTGWSYDSGNDNYSSDGSQSAQSMLSQTIVGTSRNYYQISFTVSNRSAGSIAGFVGSNQGDFVSANGSYVQIIEVDLASNAVGVVADADFIGTVDNISCKKVTRYETVNLIINSSTYSGWYGYYFGETDYKADLLAEFPKYFSNSLLRVKINWLSGQLAKCGVCAVGEIIELGMTRYDVSVGSIDYSIKSTDDFGNTYLSEGAIAKEGSVDFWLNNRQFDIVKKRIDSFSGQKVIINANNYGVNYESLIVYGFIREFSMTIPGPVKSRCSMDYQGLI